MHTSKTTVCILADEQPVQNAHDAICMRKFNLLRPPPTCAQVGALVPAESLELTPMDGCFVRMGARDAILSGQSTFYIEMAETAAMLSRSTSRSLVALDELGRGTATLDGEQQL